MGVMSCSRRDCDEIMCHTYISSVGYICYECQSEFREYLKKLDLKPKTEKEINKELGIFIHTSKDSYIDGGEEISVDEYFREHTRY